MKKFEFLEHTADIKFRVYGKNIKDVFENSALAVSHIFSRGKKIKSVKKKEFSVAAKNREALLYQFIDNIIYLFDAENFVVARVDVKLLESKLNAVVYGDDASHYKDLDSIKAATYAEMYIKQKKDKTWEAQVVVDV